MRRVRNLAIGGVALLIAGGMAAQVHHTYASPAAATKTVRATEVSGKYAFAPKSVTVAVGTRVIWKNTSDAVHTVTGTSGKAGFASYNKKLAKGKTVSFVFSKAGTYKYYCIYHPYMKGTVTVK